MAGPSVPRFMAALSCFAFPPLGGEASAAVLSDPGMDWQLNSDQDWPTIGPPEMAGGITSWKISVSKNPNRNLEASLSLLYKQSPVQTFAIYQAGGNWIEFQAEMVLQPPHSSGRGAFPLVMELGIAGKFIAQQLQKLPPPIKIAGLTAVMALIDALAASAIAARAALVNVPEPPDLFNALPPPPKNPFLTCGAAEQLLIPGCQLTSASPMTQRLICQQGGLLSCYIVQQTTGE
jgi:hypothetical protein